MFYIISYDITEDRLRNKVSKILSSYGTRVQKSVFELDLQPNQFSQVLRSLSAYTKEGGSIRCYLLCERCVEKSQSYNSAPINRDKPYYMA